MSDIRYLSGVIPTKDRIKHFILLSDLSCILCNDFVEFVDHLLFDCPITALCWLKSPWQIRINQFVARGWLKSCLYILLASFWDHFV